MWVCESVDFMGKCGDLYNWVNVSRFVIDDSITLKDNTRLLTFNPNLNNRTFPLEMKVNVFISTGNLIPTNLLGNNTL